MRIRDRRRAIQNNHRGLLTSGVEFFHDTTHPHTARQTKEAWIWLPVLSPVYEHEKLHDAVTGWLRSPAAEFYEEGIPNWSNAMRNVYI